MSSYKQLQQQLKEYRELGYELQVKLNAKTELLQAELERLSKHSLVCELNDGYYAERIRKQVKPITYAVTTKRVEQRKQFVEAANNAPHTSKPRQASETVTVKASKCRQDLRYEQWKAEQAKAAQERREREQKRQQEWHEHLQRAAAKREQRWQDWTTRKAA